MTLPRCCSHPTGTSSSIANRRTTHRSTLGNTQQIADAVTEGSGSHQSGSIRDPWGVAGLS
jgi:hypothetical protein